MRRFEAFDFFLRRKLLHLILILSALAGLRRYRVRIKIYV